MEKETKPQTAGEGEKARDHMGFLDKKDCSVCGKEIGRIGGHKLADGNLCKECAGKLSPWFSGMKKATTADIRAQLAYREENRKAVLALQPARTFGEDVKIYLDENAGKFIATRSKNWRDANPDVVSVSQVLRSVLDVKESKEEITDRDENGKPVSYDPPRYDYEYQIGVQMDIDSPYFNRLAVELSSFSDRPTSKTSRKYKELEREGKVLCAILNGEDPSAIPPVSDEEPEEAETEESLQVPEPDFNTPWTCSCGYQAIGNFCANCGTARPRRWFCPECGKENQGMFCVGCGRRRPD